MDTIIDDLMDALRECITKESSIPYMAPEVMELRLKAINRTVELAAAKAQCDLIRRGKR
jgi:hypothetical protein